MSDRPLWFDGSIIGATFALVLTAASMHVGAGLLLLNLVALACFVAPVAIAVREGEVGGGSGVGRGEA